jgi:hypothetical protein
MSQDAGISGAGVAKADGSHMGIRPRSYACSISASDRAGTSLS